MRDCIVVILLVVQDVKMRSRIHINLLSGMYDHQHFLYEIKIFITKCNNNLGQIQTVQQLCFATILCLSSPTNKKKILIYSFWEVHFERDLMQMHILCFNQFEDMQHHVLSAKKDKSI